MTNKNVALRRASRCARFALPPPAYAKLRRGKPDLIRWLSEDRVKIKPSRGGPTTVRLFFCPWRRSSVTANIGASSVPRLHQEAICLRPCIMRCATVTVSLTLVLHSESPKAEAPFLSRHRPAAGHGNCSQSGHFHLTAAATQIRVTVSHVSKP